MAVEYQTRSRTQGQSWPVPADEGLERALVAGLLLEVILETPGLPDEPRTRRHLIKSRLTDSLLAHLAGSITLDRFRSLVQRLEHWFPLYYPLMPPLSPPSPAAPASPGRTVRMPAAGTPARGLVRRDRLHEWLATVGNVILPRRPQRKIQPDRLEEVLWRTGGLWFRVCDLAHAFDIDRKTAWEYLQKLRGAGLLVHNRGRSAAVRYRLAEQFLRVKIAALRQQVGQALAGLPAPPAEPIAEWLAATAGEPFWEDRWLSRLADGRRDEIIGCLKTAAVLEVVYQSGRQRLLRLRRQWLRCH